MLNKNLLEQALRVKILTLIAFQYSLAKIPKHRLKDDR